MEHFGFEIHRLERLLTKAQHARKQTGHNTAHNAVDQMTQTHGYVLGYLYMHQQDTVYQCDIEKEFSLSPSTVTNILQVMEKNGLISRTYSEADNRFKCITLTQKGASLQAQVDAEIDDFESSISKGVTKEEADAFFLVTHKLRRNLGDPTVMQETDTSTCPVNESTPEL